MVFPCFARSTLPSILRANVLIFEYVGNGSAVFDPNITTNQSTSILWFPDGQSPTRTTGTSHAFSYVPTTGPHRCVVRVDGGLKLVTGIEAPSDAITLIRNLIKTRLAGATLSGNPNLTMRTSDFPKGIYGTMDFSSGTVGISGPLSDFLGYTNLYANGNALTGSLLDIYINAQKVWLMTCVGIASASIAHLVAIRDLRIYSMGWTAAQYTTVLLSAWTARASYTYTGGIVLHIGTPTGTPDTEIPETEGEPDSVDWHWNSGTGKYEPLSGYAAIFYLSADPYSEGIKTWSVTLH